MQVKQLELDLWDFISTARETPNDANLPMVFQLLDLTLVDLDTRSQLRVAGEAVCQIADLFCDRSSFLFEELNSRTGKGVRFMADDAFDRYVRQSMVGDFEQVIEPLQGLPRKKSVESAQNGNSIVQEIDKETLIQTLEKESLLSFEEELERAISTAHAEDVSAWIEAIAHYIVNNSYPERLQDLQRTLPLPIVEIWLGLLLMDPQSSLTKFVGLVPSELGKTVANAIIDEEALPIHKDLLGMDFVPANRFLSATEMQLVSSSLRDFRLKDALELVQQQYDYILLDCPPSLGLLSYISLVAATHVLVPVETHLKAFEGTDELLQTLTYVKSKPNKQLQVIGFVPTRYDGRNSADIRTLEAMNEQLATWGKVFEAIPRATAFVDASEERLPLAALQAKHPAVNIMNKIIDHIEKLA